MTGLAELLCRASHPTRWEYAALSKPCDECSAHEPVVLAWIAERLADPTVRREVRGPRAQVEAYACGFGSAFAEVRRVLGVEP